MADGEHYTVSTDEGILRFRYDSDTGSGFCRFAFESHRLRVFARRADDLCSLRGQRPSIGGHTPRLITRADARSRPLCLMPPARRFVFARWQENAYSDRTIPMFVDLEQVSTLRITEDGE